VASYQFPVKNEKLLAGNWKRSVLVTVNWLLFIMRCVITAPTKVITGAFNIRFAFPEPLELTQADVVVETLEGDALGHSKDCFGGSSKDYYILCYLPDERKGKSRISVSKEGLDVQPVTVEYDTIKTIIATWGTPIQRGSRIELPVSFDDSVQNLKKRNFRFSYATPYQLYGTGDTYSVVIPQRQEDFTVAVSGAVEKTNGLRAEIKKTILEV